MRKNQTHLGHAIFAALDAHRLNQEVIADRAGISQPSISALISRHSRPTPKTLLAICHCWPSPATNLEILIGRLKDEIELAGHNTTSIMIHPRTGAISDGAAAEIEYLSSRLHMRGVADAVLMIARLVRDIESGAWRSAAADPDRGDLAADTPGAPYDPKKRS